MAMFNNQMVICLASFHPMWPYPGPSLIQGDFSIVRPAIESIERTPQGRLLHDMAHELKGWDDYNIKPIEIQRTH